MNIIDPRSSTQNVYSAEYWAKKPVEKGWTRTPNGSKELILRIRCVRLADGQRIRWYFTVPKPLTKREQNDMLRRLEAVRVQIAAFRKDEAHEIVQRERKLLRPRTQPRRKKRKALNAIVAR